MLCLNVNASRRLMIRSVCKYAHIGYFGCRGDRTTAQLAAEFSVHTSQFTSWKKQLLDQVAGLFEDGCRKEPDESSADEQQLYE
jgi:transposase